jgi:hypothetical protein
MLATQTREYRFLKDCKKSETNFASHCLVLYRPRLAILDAQTPEIHRLKDFQNADINGELCLQPSIAGG